MNYRNKTKAITKFPEQFSIDDDLAVLAILRFLLPFITVRQKLNKTNDYLYKKNETLKRAVIRSLEIIGETSKKIPASINL